MWTRAGAIRHDGGPLSWNPGQYLKFAQPRLRPALDLLARIALDAPGSIHDLGCGTGNVTRLLAQRWPDAAVTGVDDSPSMLEQAGESSGRIIWRRQSIAHWSPDAPADLVFSNAALHWLPDHATLFPRLMGTLARGGVLAVQMPRNFDAPSHTLIADVIRARPWRGRLEPLLKPSPVEPPAFYHRVLAPIAGTTDVWESEYLQVLRGDDPVKQWVKGTWLVQFLDALDPTERPTFEAEYARRLREAYPPESDGTTLFPFRRLFLIATRAK
jgi:trans-aconitate 2-methyltransferase